MIQRLRTLLSAHSDKWIFTNSHHWFLPRPHPRPQPTSPLVTIGVFLEIRVRFLVYLFFPLRSLFRCFSSTNMNHIHFALTCLAWD